MGTPQSVQKRRLSNIYVEIPASPFDLTKYQPISSSSCVRRVPAKQNMQRATLKRKLSNNGMQSSTSFMKKAKQDSLGDGDLDGSLTGSIYCHQCSQRRDAFASIQCTNITPLLSGNNANVKALRCTTKYCEPCLKNRYGEDLSQIKIGANSSSGATGHVENVGYIFKCPMCRDICNCRRCRKLKGLDSLGSKMAVEKASNVSAARMTTTSGTGQLKNKRDQNITHDVSDCTKPTRNSSECTAATPKWIALPLPPDLSVVEDRIYIREFMLRFSGIMDPPINKNHLEELELIGGGFRGREEHKDMAPWVSESCIRSMVLGILSLLIPECHNAEAIKSAMKAIRAMGANLNKVWNTLQSLRDVPRCQSCSSDDRSMTFPDPLPPPVSATMYQTRSMRNATNSPSTIHIHCSAQMVPVLVAFVDFATTTNAVREETEASLRAVKEHIQISKEAIKLEKERWEKTRQALDNNPADKGKIHFLNQKKTLRAAHKRRLFSIEKAADIISSNYGSRFTGLLGKDDHGRLYWTISPGVEEVTAARCFIANVQNKEASESSGYFERKSKEQAVAKTPCGCSFREWSQFMAVWGRSPENKRYKAGKAEDPDGNEETWWAIGEPEEIRRLANWLVAGSSKRNIQALSKRIADFADLLEWRTRVDRYELID